MFRKARFIARRAVPVLATIMLLTYTSLVNSVIAPLRYTALYNADTTQGETVWLYQPSLVFFNGQHLVLGILSIAVTLIYLVPFTFTMLFGDLMRRYFHKLWFSHFMDVLHGAFRWPLGFWIGIRLLIRVILVVIGISTNPNTSAFCTLAAAGTLLVVQLLVKPFRDPNVFRQGPPTCKRKCLTWIKTFLNRYHAPLFDTLYLLNIALTSAMISFGSNSQTLVLSAVGANILILLALAQFAVILVYHAYNFFPVPEKARSCAQSCWSTMHAIPSMLKDSQCCQKRPREEEEPRRSPTPILILRPPEIYESYDSESDTSSYNGQPPLEEVEPREGSLQEPLLTNWYWYINYIQNFMYHWIISSLAVHARWHFHCAQYNVVTVFMTSMLSEVLMMYTQDSLNYSVPIDHYCNNLFILLTSTWSQGSLLLYYSIILQQLHTLHVHALAVHVYLQHDIKFLHFLLLVKLGPQPLCWLWRGDHLWNSLVTLSLHNRHVVRPSDSEPEWIVVNVHVWVHG